MEWEVKRKQLAEKLREERKRFLAMSDEEAMKMSHSDRYQRMVYLNEETFWKEWDSKPHHSNSSHHKTATEWRVNK